MPRSVEAERKAITGGAPVAKAPAHLSTAERRHFRAIVLSLPPQTARTPAIVALCADLAVAREEISTCHKVIAKQGLMTADGPHPLLMVRHRATLRAAALTSRLKLLPSADAREAQRWARFAGKHGAPPEAVRHNGAVRKSDGSIDWIATARKAGLQ